ncbi:phosphatase PAP2 family protein [Acidiferrimicrobium sp. IK]|uniref:phosphatase PAP2 family protein n=1 Tax=Acidiferrimicrobium sp. IK TaxID=2871700 RepID=UPI0021CB9274|nr:phosphatase PAP2 family protein [Acidiferrimicrobium sp. IK]MCU4183945.1 phosphatase PAP2 family protein [Acidiferrimicrobium sp. IK]
MLQWLPWEDAAEMAAVTGVAWSVSRHRRRRVARLVHPWAKELTLVLVLYAMWQYAGRWSLGRAALALGRGRRIWAAERTLGLPSERSLQRLVLGHRGVVHWLNVFYAQAHVPALGLLLVWLFVRHRERYPQVRTVVALVTGASLLIQLLPVAPPRLIPSLGVVDTGALVGPSDYAGGAPGIDQLSAMPSLHVAWALVVAGGVLYASRSRMRWLVVGYPLLTVFTVVATGNHYWADAAVAAALCLLAGAAVRVAYRPPAASAARILNSADEDLAGVVEPNGAGDQVVDAAGR